MSVNVGDRVQIKSGAKDVTNGKAATKGFLYGEGGSKTCVVEAIVKDWYTEGKFGLPKKVTKVRCSDNGVVVWQIQPNDVIVKIDSKKQVPKKKQPTKPKIAQIPSIKKKPSEAAKESSNQKNSEYIGASNSPYAIVRGSETWATGTTSSQNNNLYGFNYNNDHNTGTRDTHFNNANINSTFLGSFKSLNQKQLESIGSKRVFIDTSIQYRKTANSWMDKNKREQMLNLKKDIIQNPNGFPYFKGQKSSMLAAQYDYQIILDDSRYSKMKFADRLMEVRAELGIPVHGNNQIAKSMKYYMYNRFHGLDLNLNHNKSVTYVFFTRPDLNLLEKTSQGYKAVEMIENHTEAAMVWRRHPAIFKLLTDRKRCDDANNFNMLLSNQVQTFDIQDENLSTDNVGKTWNEYEMQYGNAYSGRTAGSFSCEFTETSEYEVINLLKLWITYIDNVSRGAWSPSYNLYGAGRNDISSSHVHTKTIDYASSAYVFKCGPDGEDVLYWSKYYGVFPTNTGSNALSWNNSNPIGDSLKLNINFAYSYKRDLSPISLIEFNNISGVDNVNGIFEPSYNPNTGHSSRPYVGAPYIEMDLGVPQLQPNDVDRVNKKTQIRLKFRADTKDSRSDSVLFKSH